MSINYRKYENHVNFLDDLRDDNITSDRYSDVYPSWHGNVNYDDDEDDDDNRDNVDMPGASPVNYGAFNVVANEEFWYPRRLATMTYSYNQNEAPPVKQRRQVSFAALPTKYSEETETAAWSTGTRQWPYLISTRFQKSNLVPENRQRTLNLFYENNNNTNNNNRNNISNNNNNINNNNRREINNLNTNNNKNNNNYNRNDRNYYINERPTTSNDNRRYTGGATIPSISNSTDSITCHTILDANFQNTAGSLKLPSSYFDYSPLNCTNSPEMGYGMNPKSNSPYVPKQQENHESPGPAIFNEVYASVSNSSDADYTDAENTQEDCESRSESEWPSQYEAEQEFDNTAKTESNDRQHLHTLGINEHQECYNEEQPSQDFTDPSMLESENKIHEVHESNICNYNKVHDNERHEQPILGICNDVCIPISQDVTENMREVVVNPPRQNFYCANCQKFVYSDFKVRSHLHPWIEQELSYNSLMRTMKEKNVPLLQEIQWTAEMADRLADICGRIAAFENDYNFVGPLNHMLCPYVLEQTEEINPSYAFQQANECHTTEEESSMQQEPPCSSENWSEQQPIGPFEKDNYFETPLTYDQNKDFTSVSLQFQQLKNFKDHLKLPKTSFDEIESSIPSLSSCKSSAAPSMLNSTATAPTPVLPVGVTVIPATTESPNVDVHTKKRLEVPNVTSSISESVSHPVLEPKATDEISLKSTAGSTNQSNSLVPEIQKCKDKIEDINTTNDINITSELKAYIQQIISQTRLRSIFEYKSSSEWQSMCKQEESIKESESPLYVAVSETTYDLEEIPSAIKEQNLNSREHKEIREEIPIESSIESLPSIPASRNHMQRSLSESSKHKVSLSSLSDWLKANKLSNLSLKTESTTTYEELVLQNSKYEKQQESQQRPISTHPIQRTKSESKKNSNNDFIPREYWQRSTISSALNDCSPKLPFQMTVIPESESEPEPEQQTQTNVPIEQSHSDLNVDSKMREDLEWVESKDDFSEKKDISIKSEAISTPKDMASLEVTAILEPKELLTDSKLPIHRSRSKLPIPQPQTKSNSKASISSDKQVELSPNATTIETIFELHELVENIPTITQQVVKRSQSPLQRPRSESKERSFAEHVATVKWDWEKSGNDKLLPHAEDNCNQSLNSLPLSMESEIDMNNVTVTNLSDETFPSDSDFSLLDENDSKRNTNENPSIDELTIEGDTSSDRLTAGSDKDSARGSKSFTIFQDGYPNEELASKSNEKPALATKSAQKKLSKLPIPVRTLSRVQSLGSTPVKKTQSHKISHVKSCTIQKAASSSSKHTSLIPVLKQQAKVAPVNQVRSTKPQLAVGRTTSVSASTRQGKTVTKVPRVGTLPVPARRLKKAQSSKAPQHLPYWHN